MVHEWNSNDTMVDTGEFLNSGARSVRNTMVDQQVLPPMVALVILDVELQAPREDPQKNAAVACVTTRFYL